ncbi:MAG: S8 family serine peptidase [Oligoflexia bacterium]|nr:S8 family serine peptidase [Oligoflexia bacterium]
MPFRIWKSVGLAAILLFATTSALASQRYLIRYKTNTLVKSTTFLKSFGLEQRQEIPQLNLVVAEALNTKGFLEVGLKQLRASPDVLYVEKSFKVHTFLKPNDPKYNSLDGLIRTNIETAWETTTGSSSIIVAVTDSGVALNHDDLKNRLWKNTREVPNNGKDDDSNGYVDDYEGWDFHSNDNDSTDALRHGTHVSGIIGAEGNNGVGIVGANWNVRIMPLKFLDDYGGGNIENAAAAIIYAADNGARIINASWGGGPESQTVKDAIVYANNKGTLFVAASGNDQNDNDATPTYPASSDIDGIISVAASQSNGQLAGFSNYGGTKVDIAAPGKDVYSTLLNNEYGVLSGTSMASPMVAGIAALILSVEPGLSVRDLKNAVLNSANYNSGYVNKLATSGDIDAVVAIRQLSQGFQVWPARMNIAKGASFTFTAYKANGAVTWSVDNAALASIDANGALTALENGEVKVTAKNAAGAIASTLKVTISDGTGSGGGGAPGCGKSSSQSSEGIPTAMVGLALPFALGAILRRRKK